MKIRFSIFLILVAAAWSGCDWRTPPEPPAPPPQEVGVVTLKAQPVEITLELPGRTTAYRIAEVRPQVSGIILKRLFTEGGEVKAEQPLYQIDPAIYQATSNRAEALVKRQEAAVHVAQLLASRRKELIQSKVISQQDRDDAVAALEQAQADLAVAQANLAKARIDLVYTKVLSPIAGTIGRSAVTEGALVTTGQAQALATVQQLDPIYVDITQPSARLLEWQRKIASGELKRPPGKEAKVHLTFDDGRKYPETGRLQFSEVSVDPSTGSVTLRAVFPNPEHGLLPGMFVRAEIAAGVRENTILAPQRGVTHNQRGEPTALVVGADNKVELRTLAVSRTIGDQWLVTKGLSAGDRIIVEGQQKARPGAVVEPVETKTETTPSAGE